ncbi:VDAC2 [Cordylochernes scorpioides]|uniref:VDAC2 n=1 Tax=Cordylochernes scorpioides TaxID=51811 RepID=A0ABY6KES9_9ARAC|nr:VDAC2 [Cordylochernes scorpioides]UYV67278.1 VDAC2 [Cordylochernes scorpioides]
MSEEQITPTPAFSDLGKHCRSLFEKYYSFGLLNLKAKTMSPLGIDFKMDGIYDISSKKVDASLESLYVIPEWKVSFVEKWCSDNTLSTDVGIQDLFLKGIFLGTGSKFSMDTGSKSFFFRSGYKMNVGNVDLDFNIEPPSYNVRLSSVASFLGWLVGGRLIADFPSRKLILSSFSLGYYNEGFILHSNVTNSREFSASIFHQISCKLDTGIRMSWTMGSNLTQLGLGAVYRLDDSTTFRGKVDNQNFIGLGFSQKLSTGVVINFGACLDGKNFTHGQHQIGLGIEMEA